MKKAFLFLHVISMLVLNAEEVDIVSSFNIDHLPTQLLQVKKDFILNATVPIDYYTKPALDTSLKKIIVFDPFFGGGREVFPTLPKEKLVLFVWEPGKVPLDVYDAYSRVYTWDDSLVDNVKFFRFNYPYLMPYKDNSLAFEQKKLCTLVVGNWTEQRLNIVQFFDSNHPQELEYYGRPHPGLKNIFMYKGHIPGPHSGEEKIATLQNYRFCICFENTMGTQGYITEKIFSCFSAGSIPIYWGPDNIEDYIPRSCFIDYRDFSSNAELYQYISTMPKERYEEYLEQIRGFLKSESAQIFSPQFFENLICEAISAH